MSDMKLALEIMQKLQPGVLAMHGDDHAFSIEPYLNGRERGFVIIDTRNVHELINGSNKAVAFAMNRNSDETVIYSGNDTDFMGMPGNLNRQYIPKEQLYRTRKLFRNIDDAVIFIKRELKI